MNKIFIFLCFSPFFSFAQEDIQTSILTDDGIFTVSKTKEGKDMILVNTDLWNDIVRGTKYLSENLAALPENLACIVIANKKHMLCAAGIGFRCGIFDYGKGLKPTPDLINNTNRVCSVMIQKEYSDIIKIIFLDKVDWCSLQNDQ
jgi:hypothetical protein